jgi:hypothetical protein
MALIWVGSRRNCCSLKLTSEEVCKEQKVEVCMHMVP